MDLSEANNLAHRFNRVLPVQIDILQDEDHLKKLVGQTDLVVSLLPSQFHHLVAEQCIELKKNMVTASYCSDQMSQLHDRWVMGVDLTIYICEFDKHDNNNNYNACVIDYDLRIYI